MGYCIEQLWFIYPFIFPNELTPYIPEKKYLYRAQFLSIGFHIKEKVSCLLISKTHLYMCDQGLLLKH